MGIQGFTKYINDRAHLYFENYELRDCTLIIDGHSISCQLYNWKHWQFDARSNNSYGGDYDKYAYIVENFFGMFKEVKVKPIVVFDGGFEQRKLPTILNRMQDKINIADKLNPGYESTNPNSIVFPLFLREAFKDILRNLDIQMVMCEYEGDSEIASIAKSLNCPILTFDSDYFLFGAQYIPFKTLDSKVRAIENWRTGTYKCISCKLYRIEKFLGSHRGLQENTFHLLPVLLGNDYIGQKTFCNFLQSINANDINNQDKIQVVLDWLKNETPETATQKILKSFKTTEQKLFILNKIEKIVTGYYFVESRLFKYLNVEGHTNRKYKRIDFSNLRELLKNDTSENGTHNNSPERVGANEDEVMTVISKEIAQNAENVEEAHHSESESPRNDFQEGNTTNKDESPKNEFQEGNTTNKDESPKNDFQEGNTTNKETEASETSSGKIDETPENGIHDNEVENGEVPSSENQSLNNKPESQMEVSPEKSEDDDEEMPLSSTFNFEDTNLEKDNISKNSISKLFQKNFTKCSYPSAFMDILTQNTYYCIPQVENHCAENSHIFSFDILRAIHKILTDGNSSTNFTIVARGEGSKIKWFKQEQYNIPVPSLEEIEQLPLQGRRETLFRILNIDNNSFVSLLDQFPTEWHTFLIALKFAASKTTFETPLIYSLVLGFILLNYIDQRIGYYRSAERYKQKYYSYMQNLPRVNEHVPFRVDKNCFYYFPCKDCIVFMQKVVQFFTLNAKETSESFDKRLIHQMAQIQSVLLHIKYLNSLLKNPYPNLVIHQIFDSTFIYNLSKVFTEKSAELENNYLNVFFKDCPTILAALKYVLNMLNKQIIL